MPEKTHPNHPEHVLLESDRLQIRRPEEGDQQHLERVFCNPEMMQYLGGPWTPHQVAKARAEWHDDWGTGNRWHGILIHRPTSTSIGTAGCSQDTVDGESGLELSWFVLPAYQRRGFASEITSELLCFAFTTLRINRALAETHPDNPASNGVLRRLGFSRLRERAHTYDDLPGFDRQILWEQTLEDWQGRRPTDRSPQDAAEGAFNTSD